MGYIMDLRKQVGHRPLIMTSACVLILNEKNQLLLQKRRDNGTWSYPGGSMEMGETFEECARREAFEETGLCLKDMTFFTNNSGEKMHYIYPNGDEVYIAEVVFLCREYEGRMKVQEDEIIMQSFFELDQLPEPIFSVNKDTIQKLAAYVKKQENQKKC